MKRGIDDDPEPESIFLKKIPSPNTKAPKIIRKKVDTNAYIIINAHGCLESENILYIPPGISMLHKKNTAAYGFCNLQSISNKIHIGEIMDNLIKEKEIREESFPTYHDVYAERFADVTERLADVTAEHLHAFNENPEDLPESVKKSIAMSARLDGPITEEFCKENTCKVIATDKFANRKYSPISISASGIPLIIYLSYNHKRYNLFHHADIQKLAEDTNKVREAVAPDRISSSDTIFRSIFEKVHRYRDIELTDIFSILYAICATSCNIIDFSCAAECSNTKEQYKSGFIHPPIHPLEPGKGYGKRLKTRRGKNKKYKRNTRRRK
jgi:hypothetical protein